jgi:uncharacterized membrane protein (UPF0127 family)
VRLDGLPRARLLGFEVPVAHTGRARLLGLAFLDRDQAGEGLLIPECRAIHTFGMRFPLDVLFLAEDATVIDLRRELPPRRFAACARASAVLELPSPLREQPSRDNL